MPSNHSVPLMATLLFWAGMMLPGLAPAAAPRTASRPPVATLAPLVLAAAPVISDTLHFEPAGEAVPDSNEHSMRLEREPASVEDEWLEAPFGDDLLTDLDQWRQRGKSRTDEDVILDYNRVDQLRLGFRGEYGPSEGLEPRLAARFEYAFGRDRPLYGFQVEQPLVKSGRFALGASFTRRTDHTELQQIQDYENSLALLFGRQDYRNYFEREGADAYAMWRVPDFSTISVHLREDAWRSLGLLRGTRSWFHTDRALRDNPAIDEGDTRTVTLRLERLAHRSSRTRAGFYHWLELERAGAGLGGDFEYTRGLADLRSVLRLSPATTLSLRGVAGSTFAGTLPRQKEFTVGGVDGLRGHSFAAYRGNHIALAQAEYTVGLWRIASDLFEGGLHAIVFLDMGRAWSNLDNRFDAPRQSMQADGGFGFSTSEENVRVYLARNLQRPDSDFVVSLRLQRPF